MVEDVVRPDLRQRQESFERYVIPEVDVLLRVALSMTRNAADAEDLVQDTLIRAYKSIEHFDGAHPRAWLLTIVRNTQINRTRRRLPELLRDPDATFGQLADDSADSASPETLVTESTFDAAVVQALAALPDRYLEIVTLVDIDGLSYAEVAESLGVPVGTVMSRLHRARTRMRQRLAASGVAPRHRRRESEQ